MQLEQSDIDGMQMPEPLKMDGNICFCSNLRPKWVVADSCTITFVLDF